jgi:protoheme IX farnesyltransferase
MNTFPLCLELAKPRILSMVLVTTTLGFFLGGQGIHPIPLFLLTLMGVGCATGGSAMLNNYLERHTDAKMSRTRDRVLPAGLIEPAWALIGGVGLVLAGVLLLAWCVNLLTGFLVLLAAFLYVLVYTPLKRVTWLNTTFGAIPGAIPPMAGWAAATGRIDPSAWVLFAILFAWQHPHFFAIAWMFRDDYRAAGFKMLPVVEPTGERTFRQTLGFSVLLIGVSLLPTVIGMAGWFYFWGALFLGLAMLAVAACFARKHDAADAHRLLRFSVFYLPLLLLFVVLDAT